MAVAQQIKALAHSVLLHPMPELGTLEVRGDDRQSWLNGLLTNDIKPLRAGDACYALSVNKKGRLQAEVWVAVQEQRILLGVRKELVEQMHQTLNVFLIMEDADLAIVREPLAWWLALGPAHEAVARVARTAGASAFGCSLRETPATLLVALEARMPMLTEPLLDVEGALLATPEGWEHICIERMWPRYGVDFEAGVYPQEASLETLAVSFDKGCYVGQEAVFMLHKRGQVNKRLVRLALDDTLPLTPGTEIHDAEGGVVGSITSAVAREHGSLAIGLVRYEQTKSGTALRVAGRAATVVCLTDEP